MSAAAGQKVIPMLNVRPKPQPPSIPVPGPFPVSFSIPIPPPVQRHAPRPSLPFDDYFNAYEAAARDGHKPTFFVPCSFFVGRPGVKAEKVTPAYVQAKVREKFTAWLKADERRSGTKLYPVQRNGTDDASLADASNRGIRPEAGVSFWVDFDAPAEPTSPAA